MQLSTRIKNILLLVALLILWFFVQKQETPPTTSDNKPFQEQPTIDIPPLVKEKTPPPNKQTPPSKTTETAPKKDSETAPTRTPPSPKTKVPTPKKTTPSPPPNTADRFENSRLSYTRHARCRMDCRYISESEINDILRNGKINQRKSKPYDSPCPSYALEGRTEDNQQVRIVFADCDGVTKVITAIDLDTDHYCKCD